MRIVSPSVVIESLDPDALRTIERIGRTSYKSEDRITEVLFGDVKESDANNSRAASN